MNLSSDPNPHITFSLAFPTPLDSREVQAFLVSLSGATDHLVFELLAEGKGIQFYVTTTFAAADFLAAQLRALVPGVRVTPARRTYAKGIGLGVAIELKSSNPERTLRIVKPEHLSTSILASMTGLKPGEKLLLQTVLGPAIVGSVPSSSHGHHRAGLLDGFGLDDPDDVKDLRAKLETPNWLACVRIAAVAHTEERALHLVGRVQAALSSTDSAGAYFKRRFVWSAEKLFERIELGVGSFSFGCRFSVEELAALLGWPLGEPAIVGLPRSRARHLAATSATARTGRIVAVSNYPGDERPLALSEKDSLTHCYILGPTDAGKTTLMLNLFAQDVARGRGAIVIEKTGDFFTRALDVIPPRRVSDVAIIDVRDCSWPVSFNVLAQGNPQIVASNLKALFSSIFGRGGVRFPELLYHGVMTLLTSQAAAHEAMAFTDLMPLLVPRTPAQEQFAEALIRGVEHDEMLSAFWQRLGGKSRDRRDLFTEPALDRLWELCARTEVANIISQGKSSIDLGRLIRQKKIILVNLSGLGDEIASTLGSLIVSAIWDAVLGHAADPKAPTYLFLDEFQEFLKLGTISPADMLAQSRKYGLALHLAHQEIGQLNPPMLSAILANCRSKIIFATSAKDARLLADEFGSQVTKADFDLGKYEVVMRLIGKEGLSQPMTGVTLPPPKAYGLSNQIRQLSRTFYARPVSEVEGEIKARRERVAKRFGGQQRPKPPQVGKSTWGE